MVEIHEQKKTEISIGKKEKTEPNLPEERFMLKESNEVIHKHEHEHEYEHKIDIDIKSEPIKLKIDLGKLTLDDIVVKNDLKVESISSDTTQNVFDPEKIFKDYFEKQLEYYSREKDIMQGEIHIMLDILKDKITELVSAATVLQEKVKEISNRDTNDIQEEPKKPWYKRIF